MEGRDSAPTAQEQKSTITPRATPGVTPRARGGTEACRPCPRVLQGSQLAVPLPRDTLWWHFKSGMALKVQQHSWILSRECQASLTPGRQGRPEPSRDPQRGRTRSLPRHHRHRPSRSWPRAGQPCSRGGTARELWGECQRHRGTGRRCPGRPRARQPRVGAATQPLSRAGEAELRGAGPGHGRPRPAAPAERPPPPLPRRGFWPGSRPGVPAPPPRGVRGRSSGAAALGHPHGGAAPSRPQVRPPRALPPPPMLPELGNKLSPPSPSRCRRLPAELPRSRSCRGSRRQPTLPGRHSPLGHGSAAPPRTPSPGSGSRGAALADPQLSVRAAAVRPPLLLPLLPRPSRPGPAAAPPSAPAPPLLAGQRRGCGRAAPAAAPSPSEGREGPGRAGPARRGREGKGREGRSGAGPGRAPAPLPQCCPAPPRAPPEVVPKCCPAPLLPWGLPVRTCALPPLLLPAPLPPQMSAVAQHFGGEAPRGVPWTPKSGSVTKFEKHLGNLETAGNNSPEIRLLWPGVRASSHRVTWHWQLPGGFWLGKEGTVMDR